MRFEAPPPSPSLLGERGITIGAAHGSPGRPGGVRRIAAPATARRNPALISYLLFSHAPALPLAGSAAEEAM
jgi:hypothetical protein